MNFYEAIQKNPNLSEDQKEVFANMMQMCIMLQCAQVLEHGVEAPPTPYQDTCRGIDKGLHQGKWQRQQSYQRGEDCRLPKKAAAQKEVDHQREILFLTPLEDLERKGKTS